MINHRRLFNLFASNSKRGTFKAEGNTLFLYDVIVGTDADAEYFGGVSPQAFSKALAGLTGPVALRINSPGGDVFAARAMAQAMREYAGEITAHVDGYAASSASLIAVSASKTIMAPGSFMMIHKAWTWGMGNSDDLTATANLLAKVDGTLAETYATKSGGDAAKFSAMMAIETWFTPQEAIDAGLADEIAAETAKASALSTWNMSAFDGAPKPAAAVADPAIAAAAAAAVVAAAELAAADDDQAEFEQRQRAHATRMLALTA